MLTGHMIWGAALAAYLAFRGWYDNWRGPLRPHEIDAFMTAMEGGFAESGNDPSTLRAFLEADDGREFIMVNLVKANMELVKDPDGGAMVPGINLLKRYATQFVRRLMRKGGHPGIVGRKVGGYIDAWNAPPDPAWTIFGLVRYRSRRDMIELALDPTFKSRHAAKIAGTAVTFSFPAQRMVSLFVTPRLTVALLIALAAALTHLTTLMV